MHHLAERRFRAHPDYEYVEFDRLTAAEALELSDLRDDPQYAGILRPRPGSALRAKAICAETARLFHDLAVEGPLPKKTVERLGDRADEELFDLVAVDVLQVWCDEFVSGPVAHHALLDPSASDTGELGSLAELSRDAIRHAARLPILDPLRLSAQLYFYNRMPITPRRRRQLGSPADCLVFLGLGAGSGLVDEVDTHWRRTSDADATRGWHSWSPRKREQRRRISVSYKLYISPMLDAMPDTFAAAVKVFAEEGISHFKVGRDVSGLARSDKLVAYSSDFSQLQRAGQRLALELRDAPEHGVPFTAALTPGRLVSWGMDPDPSSYDPSGEGSSWRTWIASRIAAALIDVRQSGITSIEPWQYAMDRLGRDGIDTRTWAPTHLYDEKRLL